MPEMIIKVPRTKGIIMWATSEHRAENLKLCDSDYGCGIKISKVEVKASLPYQNAMSNVLLKVPDGP